MLEGSCLCGAVQVRAPMTHEFYADTCPGAYALRGDHQKLTTDQTISLFTGG